ncbi:MAG TPA: right-handed parallel beta-helix repeat-containing protein [Vicinamibacterales bacterium]|nr:right-handed parallel beta-helix repeat-containing protein [Vicinamibacterales bacterium]
MTQTARFGAGLKKFTGHGIGIDAANVKVRGNQVVFTDSHIAPTTGTGIFTVNDAAILIEGNRVMNWQRGIEVRVAGAATVTGNEVIGNLTGIDARGGNIVRNVATGNRDGFLLGGAPKVENNSASKNTGGFGFLVLAGFSGTLTKNNMFSNARRGISGCGVQNTHVVGLDATNNYWGSRDGPGFPPADLNCDSTTGPGTGTTKTAPFATKPFKVKLVKP